MSNEMELRDKISAIIQDAPEDGVEPFVAEQAADRILAIPEIRDALANRALATLYALAEGGSVTIMTAKEGGQLIGKFSLGGQTVNHGDTITLPSLKFTQS